MQFIDQSPDYRQKSLSLKTAISKGRAKASFDPEFRMFGHCFRPELEIAKNFDRRIDKRLTFDELPTPQKADLLISELLPDFFVPEGLAASGRSVWSFRFLIDGDVERFLLADSSGLHRSEDDLAEVSFELETDILTLMSLLRWLISVYARDRRSFMY